MCPDRRVQAQTNGLQRVGAVVRDPVVALEPQVEQQYQQLDQVHRHVGAQGEVAQVPEEALTPGAVLVEGPQQRLGAPVALAAPVGGEHRLVEGPAHGVARHPHAVQGHRLALQPAMELPDLARGLHSKLARCLVACALGEHENQVQERCRGCDQRVSMLPERCLQRLEPPVVAHHRSGDVAERLPEQRGETGVSVPGSDPPEPGRQLARQRVGLLHRTACAAGTGTAAMPRSPHSRRSKSASAPAM